MTTAVNKTKLTILNTRQTISLEKNPAGAIKTMHPQTPKAQKVLKSSEDFLLMIFKIKGIFHKGKITAAIKAIFSIMIWNFIY